MEEEIEEHHDDGSAEQRAMSEAQAQDDHAAQMEYEQGGEPNGE